MIECSYKDLLGNDRLFDLDAVVDIIRDQSAIKAGWSSLIVFNPGSEIFIELRDSPPDPRGNSADEAEEVDKNYLLNNFQITEKQIQSIKQRPRDWKFIDHM